MSRNNKASAFGFGIRWLAVVACLLLSGCNGETDSGSGEAATKISSQALPELTEDDDPLEYALANATQLARQDASSREPVTKQVRNLLLDGEARIRADAATAIGQIADVDSLPSILQAMDDADADVRQRAGWAASRIAGMDFGFRADDTPDARQQAIDRYAHFWESIQQNDEMLDALRNPSKMEEKRQNAREAARERHAKRRSV